MKIEKLKRFNIWKWIGLTLIICVIVFVVAVKGTKAKYKFTASYPAAYGTVHFNNSDLEVLAVNLGRNDGTYVSSDTIPISGYSLNENESYCGLSNGDGTYYTDSNITITYENGEITIGSITTKGTKCFLYFDPIMTYIYSSGVYVSVYDGLFYYSEDGGDNWLQLSTGPYDDYLYLTVGNIIKESDSIGYLEFYDQSGSYLGDNWQTDYTITGYEYTYKYVGENITIYYDSGYSSVYDELFNYCEDNEGNCIPLSVGAYDLNLTVGNIIKESDSIGYLEFYDQSGSYLGDNWQTDYTITGYEYIYKYVGEHITINFEGSYSPDWDELLFSYSNDGGETWMSESMGYRDFNVDVGTIIKESDNIVYLEFYDASGNYLGNNWQTDYTITGYEYTYKYTSDTIITIVWTGGDYSLYRLFYYSEDDGYTWIPLSAEDYDLNLTVGTIIKGLDSTVWLKFYGASGNLLGEARTDEYEYYVISGSECSFEYYHQ